jgi:hypothetical protein
MSGWGARAGAGAPTCVRRRRTASYREPPRARRAYRTLTTSRASSRGRAPVHRSRPIDEVRPSRSRTEKRTWSLSTRRGNSEHRSNNSRCWTRPLIVSGRSRFGTRPIRFRNRRGSHEAQWETAGTGAPLHDHPWEPSQQTHETDNVTCSCNEPAVQPGPLPCTVSAGGRNARGEGRARPGWSVLRRCWKGAGRGNTPPRWRL